MNDHRSYERILRNYERTLIKQLRKENLKKSALNGRVNFFSLSFRNLFSVAFITAIVFIH